MKKKPAERTGAGTGIEVFRSVVYAIETNIRIKKQTV